MYDWGVPLPPVFLSIEENFKSRLSATEFCSFIGTAWNNMVNVFEFLMQASS